MVQTIISKLKLDNNWIKVNLNGDSFYLIAIKEKVKKLKDKEIESSKVDKIYFEVAIDRGITDKPITINRIALDFKDETSEDEDINSITAFNRFQGFPKDFYIKPIKIVTYDSTVYSKDIETGISIKVNLN